MIARVCAGLAALLLSLCLSSGPAHAQAGIAQGVEITPGAGAAKALAPTDGKPPVDLSKNGIDTTPETPVQIQSNPVAAVSPAAKEAAPSRGLKLLNCSGKNVKVKTYNSTDSILWVAYEEKSIGNGDYRTLGCATASCKISVSDGKATSAIKGLQVLVGGGKVQASSQPQWGQGCSAFK